MAGVQQAQVQAVQALATLTTVMARPSPALQAPPLATPHAAHILTCLRQALSPLVNAAPDANKGETLWTSPGLQTHAAHCAIARSAAQVPKHRHDLMLMFVNATHLPYEQYRLLLLMWQMHLNRPMYTLQPGRLKRPWSDPLNRHGMCCAGLAKVALQAEPMQVPTLAAQADVTQCSNWSRELYKGS